MSHTVLEGVQMCSMKPIDELCTDRHVEYINPSIDVDFSALTSPQ